MYKLKKGIICAENQIPYSPRWFTDGRLVFSYGDKGIEEVDYFINDSKAGNNVIFLSDIFGGVVNYVRINGERYLPDKKNIRIYPFGISYDFNIRKNKYSMSFFAVEEKIIISLDMPENCNDKISFDMEFFDSFLFVPFDHGNLPYRNTKSKRVWNEKCVEDNCVDYSFCEYKDAQKLFDFSVCISADFPFEYKSYGHSNSIKNAFYGESLSEGKHSFIISFNEKNTNLSSDFIKTSINNQIKRYKNAYERSPHVKTLYEGIDKFFEIMPLYHESLKLRDYKGAIRAKTTNYWTWGWDTITYSCATAYMGDSDFLKDALLFFENHNFNSEGISMAYKQDMSVLDYYSQPSNGLYIILLYIVFCNERNKKTVERFYPTVLKFFNGIIKTLNQSGFVEGYSMFPDYPGYMEENGNDLSAFNSTLYYSAFRCMEYLCVVVNDYDTRRVVREILDKQEKSFINLFFNEEKNFFVSSVDSNTYKQRSVYNINSIKTENGYLMEVLKDTAPKTMEFFEKNIICDMGLKCIPTDFKSYDADGNQLHYWFPVTGEYFTRLSNMLGRKDLLKKWAGWVSYWTDLLMCPEGINIHATTKHPMLDGWTTLNGAFQAFTLRTWYQSAMHYLCSISMEDGDITISPCDMGECTVVNFPFGKKRIEISVKEKGRYVKKIRVDDKDIYGTNKIPSDIIRDKSKIIIYKSVKEQKCVILSALGGRISEYEKESFVLTGAGMVRIIIHTDKKLNVECENSNSVYDEKNKIQTVEVIFDNYTSKKVSLS